MLSTVKNELTLIYHSAKENDKKARAYCASLPDYKPKMLDLKRDQLTETQLAEIADKMQIPIKELVDASYEDACMDRTHVKQMSDEDILTVLVGNPEILKTPIVLMGDGRCFHPGSSYDLIRENMEVKSNVDGNV
jgi:arsenate reductase-like glutaredoxin family protein